MPYLSRATCDLFYLFLLHSCLKIGCFYSTLVLTMMYNGGTFDYSAGEMKNANCLMLGLQSGIRKCVSDELSFSTTQCGSQLRTGTLGNY